MHFALQTSRRFDTLDITQCVGEAYGIASDLLKGEPVATGAYSVIFSPDCLKDLLGAFRSFINAESALKGLNPLRDKIGQSVGVSNLTLKDAHHVSGGMSISAFDDEGFPAQTSTLIQGGVLETFLHNSVTANHFKVANTANGSRGPKGSLGISSRHLVIEPGQQTDLKNGLYLEILSVQGTHSGANAVTGNFSFGASGFLCRNGERVQPVRGITVASNFYEMLFQIEGIGSEQFWSSDRSVYAPAIRFGNCSIAGK
jgi:PmbA protein